MLGQAHGPLDDDLLSGQWRQNTVGPPEGSLACPSASICYEMSGRYASPRSGLAGTLDVAIRQHRPGFNVVDTSDARGLRRDKSDRL